MAAKSELRKYIDATQALPADCTLGNVLWYSVEDKPYDVDALTLRYDLLGLNPSQLPVANKSINAFEKASSALHGTKYPAPWDPTSECELLVHEAQRADEYVLRQVTRKVRDKSKKELDFGKVGELTFYRETRLGGKGSARMHGVVTDPTVSSEEGRLLRAALKGAEDEYVLLRDSWDGNKVRGLLRDYVGYLNGVMMRSGVYFVHSTRTEELERLREFANGTDGASMTLFPIADLKAMREEVIQAFQVESVKELGEVVAAITKVRSSRQTLSTTAVMKLRQQYEGVMRKAGEYGRTLKVSQEHTAGAAELALDALALLERDMRIQMEAK